MVSNLFSLFFHYYTLEHIFAKDLYYLNIYFHIICVLIDHLYANLHWHLNSNNYNDYHMQFICFTNITEKSILFSQFPLTLICV